MQPTAGTLRRLEREIRSAHVPDPRVDVFDVVIRRHDGAIRRVETTVPAAAAEFREKARAAGLDGDLSIRLLPDPRLEPRTEAIVRAALAPVYQRATMNATQITQYTMGNRLTLLGRRGRFWRVRGEDGHIGWVHRGYLLRGEPPWALAWERAEGGEPVVSLGAQLVDEDDNTFARVPWGARLIQQAQGRIVLPDGRAGRLAAGDIVPVDRLADRFPARPESITRTARRWAGSPYLWGGVTPAGVDCSGLVQSVYWIHGVALPRDSDMQARVGAAIEPGPRFETLRPADLVFFATRGRVDHVAISLGGSVILHSAVSNGGVEINDLTGDQPLERLLRNHLAGVRRLLPD